jgi:RNA polymerase sigma-70 factor, ECF subfamily
VASDFQRLSDEDLARETQAGSLAAFEELVYRYQQRIYAFVTQCCRNSADAQELTQDTFVRAFQAIAQFDPRRGLAPWLFTIARRKCIDHHRAAPPAMAEEPMPDLSDLVDPSELLARREERESLWQIARRRLPEAQFQALWLRYADDMSVAGIARVLGKTQTHVKVLLFRARNALGRELKAAQVSGGPTEPARISPGHPNPWKPGEPAEDSSPALEGPRSPSKGERVLTSTPCSTLIQACGSGARSRGRVVEFPGAVAGVGPGSGKKGLL